MRDARWTISKVLIVVILPLTVILGIFGSCTAWFSDGAATFQKEFAPSALLKKYEWFKNAAAQLDAKAADIQVYENKKKGVEDAYKGVTRDKWPRDERESLRVWEQEVAGIKASFNGLAAEYNAQMAKVNWRFCNAGDLPAGADRVLPREYRAYLVN